MSTLMCPVPVLERLKAKPSRASVAAIGQEYVLNGVPTRVKLLAIDALCEMVCDWSAAIMDEAIQAPGMHLVRVHALRRLVGLVRRAVRRGYRRLNYRALTSDGAPSRDRRALQLGQAVEDGVFAQLMNF